ncbi:MAG: 2-C-methyl-D-erythritol 4-phosphate cytidylyltransferase [Candidatus Izemoplasma sp.]|nr:2-C-methyl-D-erythritol 4-phosphate cytidylyltransferase [Candidatus Izemoplasma sp.]
MKYSVLIMAAGKGTRLKLEYNKIFYKINDHYIIEYSVNYFVQDSRCESVCIVCSHNDYDQIKTLFNDIKIYVVIGGSTRQQSVFNGLMKINSEYVLIHDAARPFINGNVIDELLHKLPEYQACSLALPSKNSLVEVDGNRFVKSINRRNILQVQTPQAFKTELIKHAHQKAMEDHFEVTDDITLVAAYTNVTPRYIIGDERSIKLTTPNDIQILEVIL